MMMVKECGRVLEFISGLILGVLCGWILHNLWEMEL